MYILTYMYILAEISAYHHIESTTVLSDNTYAMIIYSINID